MVSRAKQERVIEAVRRNLEGDAAVEFVCKSGYSMTPAGILRHLRRLGGRQNIRNLIDAGKTNIEIMQTLFPEDSAVSQWQQTPPTQAELFAEPPKSVVLPLPPDDMPLYETIKLTLRIPTDLYEAIRVAAKAENKPQSQLIIDILQSVLAKIPFPPEEEPNSTAQ